MAFDDIINIQNSCDICGHEGSDVEYQVDPLAAKQWDEDYWLHMCDKCRKHLREGILEQVNKSMLTLLLSLAYMKELAND